MRKLLCLTALACLLALLPVCCRLAERLTREPAGLRESREALRRRAERNLADLKARYGPGEPGEGWEAWDREAYWAARRALRDLGRGRED